MSKFFGAELKAGATLQPSVPAGHVLTLKGMALPAAAKGAVTVTLEVDGAVALLANLAPAKAKYQAPLEVSFSAGQVFSLVSRGDSDVHVYGRLEPTGDAEFDDDEDDGEQFAAGDDSESDNAAPVKKKAKKESEGVLDASSEGDYSYGELADSDLDDEDQVGEEADEVDESLDDSADDEDGPLGGADDDEEEEEEGEDEEDDDEDDE